MVQKLPRMRGFVMHPVYSFTQGSSDVEGDSILGHRRELPMMTLLDMASSPPVLADDWCDHVTCPPMFPGAPWLP